VRNYRDLQVWSKAHRLTLELYRVSRGFPREELYGITGQLRRAAASIGANLAEGCGRRTSTELARFVRIAMGSASELDNHLLLSRDLGFMNGDDFTRCEADLIEVRKMLTSFFKVLKSKLKHSPERPEHRERLQEPFEYTRNDDVTVLGHDAVSPAC
jgi:four helix bundle protein